MKCHIQICTAFLYHNVCVLIKYLDNFKFKQDFKIFLNYQMSLTYKFKVLQLEINQIEKMIYDFLNNL